MSSRGRHESTEATPLLQDPLDEEQQQKLWPPNPKSRGIVWGSLTLTFLIALVLVLRFNNEFGDVVRPWLGFLPKDPLLAAQIILRDAPVIVRRCTYSVHLYLINESSRTVILVSCHAQFVYDVPIPSHRFTVSRTITIRQQCNCRRSGFPHTRACRHSKVKRRESGRVLLASRHTVSVLPSSFSLGLHTLLAQSLMG